MNTDIRETFLCRLTYSPGRCSLQIGLLRQKTNPKELFIHPSIVTQEKPFRLSITDILTRLGY